MRTKLLFILILLLLITSAIVWYKFVSAAGNDSNTVSLLHMNGTDGSTTFTDSAAGGTHTWTANGNAQIDTAQSKFGGASGLFDGTGDNLSVPDSDDFDLGGGNFTIDFWVKIVAFGPDGTYLLTRGLTTNSQYGISLASGNIRFENYNSGTILTIDCSFAATVSTGVWQHIAIVRNGSTFNAFQNGIKVGSDCVDTDPVEDYNTTFFIGKRLNNDDNFALEGWLDEFRISKGIARWTANFTPPGCEYNGACPPPKVPDIMVFE